MIRLLILISLALLARGATTQITDTLKTPFGTNWAGTVTVDCPSATDGAGNTIAAYKTVVTVALGVFSLAIDAGDAGTPAGRTCTARYLPSVASGVARREPWTEYWYVPTSASPLKISQIRTASGAAVSAAFSFRLISGLTAGDILYADSAGVAQRLAKPADGTFALAWASGVPSWAALQVAVPASSTDACTPQSYAADASYLYVCVASGEWRRVAWTAGEW
jgi:hypothetical protein